MPRVIHTGPRKVYAGSRSRHAQLSLDVQVYCFLWLTRNTGYICHNIAYIFSFKCGICSVIPYRLYLPILSTIFNNLKPASRTDNMANIRTSLINRYFQHGLKYIQKFRRRAYYAKYPNFIWHMDGYDKLKPYDLCINGCISGLFRKIIQLNVYHTNNNPKIIGGYFMKAVKELRGCSYIYIFILDLIWNLAHLKR